MEHFPCMSGIFREAHTLGNIRPIKVNYENGLENSFDR